MMKSKKLKTIVVEDDAEGRGAVLATTKAIWASNAEILLMLAGFHPVVDDSTDWHITLRVPPNEVVGATRLLNDMELA